MSKKLVRNTHLVNTKVIHSVLNHFSSLFQSPTCTAPSATSGSHARTTYAITCGTFTRTRASCSPARSAARRARVRARCACTKGFTTNPWRMISKLCCIVVQSVHYNVPKSVGAMRMQKGIYPKPVSYNQ